MKTIQLKKTLSLFCFLLLMLVSSPVFSQGLPNDGNDDVNDQVVAPIDQDIWLGLLGGCLIAVYFVCRPKNVLTK